MADIPEMQRLKAKYPVYKDIDDKTLLLKVAHKYPVYSHLVDREVGAKRMDVVQPPRTLESKAAFARKDIKHAFTRGVEPPKGAPPITMERIQQAKHEAKEASAELKEMFPTAILDKSPYAPLKFALKQLERPFGALKATAAGKNPVHGFLKPAEQPSFVDSVIASEFSKRVGVDPAKDPEAAAWINGLAGYTLDLGSMHLIFNTLPRMVMGVANKISNAYAGIQNVEVNALKAEVADMFKKAGMNEKNADLAARTAIYQQWIKGSPRTRLPSNIKKSAEYIRVNKDALVSKMKTQAAQAKTNAEASKYADDFVKKAFDPTPRVTAQAERVAPVVTPIAKAKGVAPEEVKMQRLREIKALREKGVVSSKIEVTPPAVKPPVDFTEVVAPVAKEGIPKLNTMRPIGVEKPSAEKPFRAEVREPEPELTKLHAGVPLPGTEEIVKAAKQMSSQLNRAIDPVGTSPAGVGRSIKQRDIDNNVLKWNVHRTRIAMNKLVPNVKDQETITRYLEPGGAAAVGGEMTPEMKAVAEIIREGQSNIGKLAKKYGVITTVLDNYVKHLVVDPQATLEEIDAKIRWAMSTGKISKFTESKFPRIRTESGEIMFPTIEALEAAGYQVHSKNALDLYEYTMLSEGTAVINAELAKRLTKVPYTDPKGIRKDLKQLMHLDKGERPPKGYRLLRRGVFTRAWASPDAYNAISAIAEPSLVPGWTKKYLGAVKQVKFLFPFFHGWNLTRNAIQARGLFGAFPTMVKGHKLLADPEKVSKVLQMGVNLFRINKISGPIHEEFFGAPAAWNIPGKMSEALFLGMGDSFAMGLAKDMALRLKDVAMGDKEKFEIIADTVNSLSGNISASDMSRWSRELGRVYFMARNWTYTNIRQARGAYGGAHPKYWSPEQKSWATRNWRASILRLFGWMYVTGNVINYMTTKHAYGKGRWTFENPGRKKLTPMIWYNKYTGKEYYISNWYGTIGDMIGWITRPDKLLLNKMTPAIKEVGQQITNRDWFTGEQIRRESKTHIENIVGSIEHGFESFQPAGVQTKEIGKMPTPFGAKVLRFLGFGISSAQENQDTMTKMYHFLDRKEYRILETDKKIYKAWSEGKFDKGIDLIISDVRYKSSDGVKDLIVKFGNPVLSMFSKMSKEDQAEFFETLTPNEQQKFLGLLKKIRLNVLGEGEKDESVQPSIK